MTSTLNKRLKQWPMWLLMLICATVILFIGAQGNSGPATPQERIEAISQRLACPTCDGESVNESRGAASQAIKKEIVRQVGAGQLSDDQILRAIDDSYAADLKLVPSASGFDALIWILPVVTFVGSVAGLIVVFRRWRSAGLLMASAQDRVLVEQAIHQSELRHDR